MTICSGSKKKKQRMKRTINRLTIFAQSFESPVINVIIHIILLFLLFTRTKVLHARWQFVPVAKKKEQKIRRITNTLLNFVQSFVNFQRIPCFQVKRVKEIDEGREISKIRHGKMTKNQSKFPSPLYTLLYTSTPNTSTNIKRSKILYFWLRNIWFRRNEGDEISKSNQN